MPGIDLPGIIDILCVSNRIRANHFGTISVYPWILLEVLSVLSDNYGCITHIQKQNSKMTFRIVRIFRHESLLLMV